MAAPRRRPRRYGRRPRWGVHLDSGARGQGPGSSEKLYSGKYVERRTRHTFRLSKAFCRTRRLSEISKPALRKLRSVKAEGIPVLTALAVVDLVADDEVQDAAHAITDALESEDGIASDEEWESLKENFIDLAQKDILPSE